MRFLFIHQNFPGQYLRLAQYLRDKGGHSIFGLGEKENIANRGTLPGITTIGYPKPSGSGEHIHPYLRSTEAAVRRGQAVARALFNMKSKGLAPDVISVHPGWGEALFVRDVFPDVPILMFCEFFFRANEADLAFDPEFPQSIDDAISIRIRNAPQLLSLPSANRYISPTLWQAGRYPECFQQNMTILHDGVDTCHMSPLAPKEAETVVAVYPLATPGESLLAERWNKPGEKTEMAPAAPPLMLTRQHKVITFVARNLEPYRGFHVFMRALPRILALHPDAHVLIVGSNGNSYSRGLPAGESYKARYLEEQRDKLDLARVHFLGTVSYTALRDIFRISSAHVYLTYPFVLSWSILEAMACEALVIGSKTSPVEEVITHGENGLLADFFDQDALVGFLDHALTSPEDFAKVRENARQTVLQHFELASCLEKQSGLLHSMAQKRL
ncbi:glycosyltransferase [Desulfovibrio sp. OttesenSCG-928-G15]|nr:glycosyltransferase [Desulfovibrio sp. OttesenSCG-928-G15]